MHGASRKALIERFSRQILAPGFGLEAQERLARSSALIIGLGGLGCPAALYLASAGIGRLGLVDFDSVEAHNLHRQILHRESAIGRAKVASARDALAELASGVRIETFERVFDWPTADELVPQFDLVVDATDNVTTRYVINDACILHDKPMVSASALRWDGQLTTYNYKVKDDEDTSSSSPSTSNPKGPCYRCLFPEPPPPETITNCDAGGIVGPVVGMLGSMQALEAINILARRQSEWSGRMLIYSPNSGMQSGPLRTVKLRNSRPDCWCSMQEKPKLRILIKETCYPQWCTGNGSLPGAVIDKQPTVQLLKPEQRITVAELQELLNGDRKFKIIDVRPREQFSVCSLPTAATAATITNIPLPELSPGNFQRDDLDSDQVIVICRRGNASQKAVKVLHEQFGIPAKDVIGGMTEYARSIDPSLPIF